MSTTAAFVVLGRELAFRIVDNETDFNPDFRLRGFALT